MGLEKRHEIFADSAEPKSIEEVYRMGFNIKPTQKGRDSIINSIDILRRYQIGLVGPNLIKEFKSYKWIVDKTGKATNSPVDYNNHSIDALRSVALMKLQENNRGEYSLLRV
jgi:phage terminase large subunit